MTPEARTLRGWSALDRADPPEVVEDGYLELRGLPPGAAVRAGGAAWLGVADDHGGLKLRLYGTVLSGHVGLVALTCGGQAIGEVEIVAAKLSAEAYQTLRRDLERVWAGLLLEEDEALAAVRAEADGPSPVAVWREVQPAVMAIAASPQRELRREPVWTRGEEVHTPAGLLRAATSPRPVVLTEAVRPTVDTVENRMVVAALESLRRACRGHPGGQDVAASITSVIRRPPFAGLRPHVTGQRPTHASTRDHRYATVLRAVQRLPADQVVITEGPGELRLGTRALPRLYEYWVFLQVVKQCVSVYGPPLDDWRGQLGVRLGRRRARLELVAGTTVRFPGALVAFEPTLAARGDGWEGLQLEPLEGVAGSVTPDVVVLTTGADPRALVIDAKYVARHLVEAAAQDVHRKYGRVRSPVTHLGCVESVQVVHPHNTIRLDWAGYGALPFTPGQPIPEVPLPLAAG